MIYTLSDRRTVMLLTYKECKEWEFYNIITMLQSHIGTLGLCTEWNICVF